MFIKYRSLTLLTSSESDRGPTHTVYIKYQYIYTVNTTLHYYVNMFYLCTLHFSARRAIIRC
jgi:hypothetical protein